MNKDYTYRDGKVIISDCRGNQKQVDYYDNLEQVLIQENVVEKMEDKIYEIKIKSNESIPGKFEPVSLYISMVGLLVNWGVLALMFSLVGYNPFLAPYGSINQGIAIFMLSSPVFLTIGLSFTVYDYRKYKKSIRNYNGLMCQIKYLRSELEKEKDKLNDLKQNKTNDNKNISTQTKSVDYSDRLYGLDGTIAAYYDLGYNWEQYYQYYKDGVLDDNLYNDRMKRDLAVECLEESAKECGKKRVKIKKSGNQ